MAEGTWLVVANGTWPTREIVKALVQKSHQLIVCDGALNRWSADLKAPTIVIGDFDSVEPSLLGAWEGKGSQLLKIDNQEINDLHKALAHIHSIGALSCLILGATGGDPAHEVANLLTCSTIPLETRCQTQTHEYLFFNPGASYSIDFEAGQEFSLFALERATGVTLKGARFPLEDETLMRGSRGLHNQATAMRIDLAYEAGNLMMIRALREEAPLGDGNEA